MEKNIIIVESTALNFNFNSGDKKDIKILVKGGEENRFNFNLDKNDCEINVKIVFTFSGEIKSKNVAMVNCLGKNNKISLDIRGVTRDLAEICFDGGAYIGVNAKGTDLNISEKGIIFDNSRIEFFPNLKIENNNVKAGHSAKVHRFSEDDIFYLMSRGLDNSSAEDLLLEGFLNEFS